MIQHMIASIVPPWMGRCLTSNLPYPTDSMVRLVRRLGLALLFCFFPLAVYTQSNPSPDYDPWGLPHTAGVIQLKADKLESHADPVTMWNAVALEVIALERQFPPPASRLLAMMHLAMHDAVVSVEGRGVAYLGSIEVEAGSSVEAAVAGAAHKVLSALFPSQESGLNDYLDLSLSVIADEEAAAAGLAVGRVAGERILADRANDGAAATSSYRHTTIVGRWRPTRPNFRPELLPQWGGVRPFVLMETSPYWPPPAPALESAKYATDLNEVAEVGEYFSTIRTDEETIIAQFWADQSGTATPPGGWNRIAAQFAIGQDLSLAEKARLFAELNAAIADSVIVCWDAKYGYDVWRPITAIVLADMDGNEETTPIPGWTSFITTPPFPDHPSGHSMISGTASGILSRWFGEDAPFEHESDNLQLQFGIPNVTRVYMSFRHAADEASKSRIYGGIHYRFACEDGVASGEEIGRAVSGFLDDQTLSGNLFLFY